MRKRYFLPLLFIVILFVNIGNAQQVLHKKSILLKTNTNKLLEYSKIQSENYHLKKQMALKKAKKEGWLIKNEYDGGLIELQSLNEKGMPVYYQTFNKNAAATVSSDQVFSGGTSKLDLDGTNMIIGEWDGGAVLKTHQEFNNTGESRVFLKDGTSTHEHSTHVAGTLIAAGIDPKAKGMASNAKLYSYDWNNDVSEMSAAAAEGLLISNHSYGVPGGWNWSGSSWSWLGDEDISSAEDYTFGFYDGSCVAVDNIAYNAPYYLIVKSAGNDRGDGEGQSSHPVDGGAYGFDCIGHEGNAKNILTVGAVNDLVNGYTGNPTDVIITSFSSFGPCDDGRIKPDICGNGAGLYSTDNTNSTSYQTMSGTSMSSPNVAGSLLLLQEHYEELFSSYMKSSTLKALVIHSANECGEFEGPDYRYGWGLLNTKNAAKIISNKDCNTRINEYTYDGDPVNIGINVNGNEPLIATIVWNDPSGSPVASQLDPIDKMLVNDLDLRITDGITTYYPYVLDGQNPLLASYKGDNDIDNVEKIFIQNPSPGLYTISVTHKGTIINGIQDFSIIISGLYSDCVQEFTAEKSGFSQIDLNWIPDSNNDEVLILWSPDNNFGVPQDYNTYISGDEILGGGTVLVSGNLNNSFSHKNLKAGNTYFYKAFTRKSDGTYTNGKIVHKTLDEGIPKEFEVTKTDYTSIGLNWQLNNEKSKILLAFSDNNTFGNPIDGSEYSPGDIITGGGEILYFGNSDTTYNHVNLNHSTQYYYRIWSFIDNKYYSNYVNILGSTKILRVSDINGKSAVVAGTSEIYKINGENYVDYNWIFPDGWEGNFFGDSAKIIVGKKGGEIIVTPSIKGLIGRSSFLKVSIINNLIGELKEFGIMLYPNPCQDNLHLSFLNDYDTINLSVIDIYGNLVRNVMFKNPSFEELNLSEISNGVYFLRFEIADLETITTKIVINK